MDPKSPNATRLPEGSLRRVHTRFFTNDALGLLLVPDHLRDYAARVAMLEGARQGFAELACAVGIPPWVSRCRNASLRPLFVSNGR
jgi:hypothetical protein